jgi:hypothetical protein
MVNVWYIKERDGGMARPEKGVISSVSADEEGSACFRVSYDGEECPDWVQVCERGEGAWTYVTEHRKAAKLSE